MGGREEQAGEGPSVLPWVGHTVQEDTRASDTSIWGGKNLHRHLSALPLGWGWPVGTGRSPHPPHPHLLQGQRWSRQRMLSPTRIPTGVGTQHFCLGRRGRAVPPSFSLAARCCVLFEGFNFFFFFPPFLFLFFSLRCSLAEVTFLRTGRR